MRKLVIGAVLAMAASSLIGTQPVFSAAAPTVVRKVLMQQDVPNGAQLAVVSVEIPVGGREGRHTHSGPLIVYVQEGALTLDYEGKPTVTYKVGETFFVESGKIHEGINNGTVPIKALASFVTPKGAPLTTQTP
ncbi:MAG TPA: cupin domain-containing protein [Micropepsaceae bacterium]|nr:cupin domain-containing protein [Micropepsaceae bacterium]